MSFLYELTRHRERKQKYTELLPLEVCKFTKSRDGKMLKSEPPSCYASVVSSKFKPFFDQRICHPNYLDESMTIFRGFG